MRCALLLRLSIRRCVRTQFGVISKILRQKAVVRQEKGLHLSDEEVCQRPLFPRHWVPICLLKVNLNAKSGSVRTLHQGIDTSALFDSILALLARDRRGGERGTPEDAVLEWSGGAERCARRQPAVEYLVQRSTIVMSTDCAAERTTPATPTWRGPSA